MQAVTSTAIIKCSFSLAPATLNVLPINRILINGKPVANIMDNKPFLNVMSMGLCTSPANPAVAAAFGAPCACVPVTTAPWINANTTVLSAGIPTLDASAKLMCAYGGVIALLMPGQFTTLIP